MRNIKKLLSGKIFWVIALVSVQIVIIGFLLTWLVESFPVANYIQIGLSGILTFWLLNKYENPSYKIIWLLIIVILPVFGFIFYAALGNKAAKRSVFKWMSKRTYKGSYTGLRRDDSVYGRLSDLSTDALRQAEYIYSTSGMPLYEDTETVYIKNGEEFYSMLKEQMSLAEHYIYLEFFQIARGEMWDGIFAVLKDRMAAGVEVRILCDDAGSNMQKSFLDEIKASGIQVRLFNPMVPVLSVKHNNRDHRKICVIDGNIAFTGGINISDEYINAVSPLGYWLDMGIMIKGRGVESFHEMFLATWNFLSGIKDNITVPRACAAEGAPGYVVPYETNPFINGDAGINIFLNMITRAKRYVYIASPYLILDFAAEQALMTAAKSGLKIKILMPGTPDKELPYLMATKHFPNLINAGVEIYRYNRGFMHGKLFLADDDFGIVSTINLDFRSLYLHFEDGIWMYKTSCLGDLKKDFEDNFSKSDLVTMDYVKEIAWYKRLFRTIITPFAPLM